MLHCHILNSLSLISLSLSQWILTMSNKKSGTSVSTKKYQVDRILKRRETTDGVKFLVKWTGLPPENATWESQTTLLLDCPSVVCHFLSSVVKREASEELYKVYLYTVDIPANLKVMDDALYNESEYLCGTTVYHRVYISSKRKSPYFYRFLIEKTLRPPAVVQNIIYSFLMELNVMI